VANRYPSSLQVASVYPTYLKLSAPVDYIMLDFSHVYFRKL
jgi:hypothetical protein